MSNYDYRNWPVMHYAVRDGDRWRRACNRNRTMRRPNCETDIGDKTDVTCARCRRSTAFGAP